MKRLHFDIVIKAPVEKVWECMLGDTGYRSWTRVFSEGSFFRGEWKTGAKMLFLAPFEGSEGGMVSRIKEASPYKHVMIEHLGMIENGVEDTTSEKVKPWAGAEENYFFKEHAEGTELRIETDMDDQHVEFFERVWPQALATLKQNCEA
ncbi:MAG: SRPBCC domain-containing protein [Leptonema illini]|uniref:SRPBCC domain-containing protein n=1 Tax=Leptonema illini TaxID=183 RepID=A0A833LWC5_9LEPT|nr:MAG: SRPBCC domain-containing protein [Leptonema illini]